MTSVFTCVGLNWTLSLLVFFLVLLWHFALLTVALYKGLIFGCVSHTSLLLRLSWLFLVIGISVENLKLNSQCPPDIWTNMGFSDSSACKESTCNEGDPSSIPGSGYGEGIGYPLQYSCASLVAQLVKNSPAMRETWVRSLGWEDPLEKGKATHSSILAWRIPWAV